MQRAQMEGACDQSASVDGRDGCLAGIDLGCGTAADDRHIRHRTWATVLGGSARSASGASACMTHLAGSAGVWDAGDTTRNWAGSCPALAPISPIWCRSPAAWAALSSTSTRPIRGRCDGSAPRYAALRARSGRSVSSGRLHTGRDRCTSSRQSSICSWEASQPPAKAVALQFLDDLAQRSLHAAQPAASPSAFRDHQGGYRSTRTNQIIVAADLRRPRGA